MENDTQWLITREKCYLNRAISPNRPPSPPPRTRPSGPAKEMLIPARSPLCPLLSVGIHDPDQGNISK